MYRAFATNGGEFQYNMRAWDKTSRVEVVLTATPVRSLRAGRLRLTKLLMTMMQMLETTLTNTDSPSNSVYSMSVYWWMKMSDTRV